ncbi:MAG: DEAD/DEAH box helicase [Candidatus Nanopelagicales bacterium]
MASEPARDLLARLAHGRPERLLHVHEVPSRPAVVAAWPDWLPAEVADAHARAGILAPWSHQAEAAEAVHAGEHVALATGTASGKSLAFGMAALAAIEAGTHAPDGRGATVLYLSPTKALANDQLRSLADLGIGWLRAATYDGDTAPEERAWVRQHANYVLTNPDLLHHSMLPGHASWAPFLRRVRLVVIDEAHAYRGVLGAHVAAVVRRLRRLCGHYGSRPPVFIASATMANPDEAGARLIGDAVRAVTRDGSPRPGLSIGFWEPPLRRPSAGGPPSAQGGRRSALAETADLLADCVIEGRQALAFVRSRRGAEATALMAQDVLADVDPALAGQVSAYRGGYLPEERRDLEARLRDGTLRAVATTSALEMGIDVSGLDVVITAGWPGTRASLWQQFGRAGRSGVPALGIFVARDDPLDSYLVRHPGAVTGQAVEATVFDPTNAYVLAPHLCAAAAEMALAEPALTEQFGPTARVVVDGLVAEGLLRQRPGGWFWARQERASDLADLRGSGGSPVRVVEDQTGRLLGTVDRAAAASTVHEGAVYVHRGVTHVVTMLDLDDGVAAVVEQEVDHTTLARSISDIRIVETEHTGTHGPLALCTGKVDVSSRVVSFQRRRVTGESLGEQPLDLPVQELRTQAVWWTLPESVIVGAGVPAPDIPGAAHAAEHASIGLLPLFATCDRWDLGGVSTALHQDTGQPTVFVYDGYPGGAGFSEHGYRVAARWLRATRSAIAGCACTAGCPSCVQSPKCGNGNEPLDKELAVVLLDVVLDALAAD